MQIRGRESCLPHCPHHSVDHPKAGKASDPGEHSPPPRPCTSWFQASGETRPVVTRTSHGHATTAHMVGNAHSQDQRQQRLIRRVGPALEATPPCRAGIYGQKHPPGPSPSWSGVAPGGAGTAQYLPGSIPAGAKSRALERLGALSGCAPPTSCPVPRAPPLQEAPPLAG